MRAAPARAAGGLFAYFTRHRTAANLVLVVMMALGLAAATQIRSQFFPDVVVSAMTVQVAWPGAGAEEVDAAITASLEPALRAVDGVESTVATAREGSVSIQVEFAPGWDMGQASQEVRAAVDGVTTLPDGAEDPVIRRAAWRDRVTDVVIHGPVPVDQLGRFADELTARLFADSITRTTVQGIADPVLAVEPSEAALVEHGLGLREVADAIAAGVAARPAGEVAGGAARLRMGETGRAADAIGSLPLRSAPDGSVLRVRDVAALRLEGADAGRAYFVAGNPAVVIRVDRDEAGDAIGMQASVAAAAEALEATLPEGVRVELVRTRAEEITDRLDILFRNGAFGLLLVVGLLFVFLNARTAFWVAAGIPVAMTAAVAFMYLGGLTINMISLFALLLCLGIVVDDAIVVGEHADARHRDFGEPPAVAAENAARRMAAPVFSAMLTTVLAFFGLMAIGGRFGSVIADIPFTVIVVLIASLIECFVILPHHMAGALAGSMKRAWYDAPSRAFNRGFAAFRERAFRPFMRAVIVARYPVLASAVLLLAVASGLFLRGDVGWRFFASPERGSITGNIAMLPGATRSETLAMVREVERAVEAVGARFEDEHGRHPVVHAISQVGGTSGRGMAADETKEPDQLGSFDLELIDADLRPYSAQAFIAALEEEVVAHPRLETLSFRSWGAGPGGDALDVKLSGGEARVLKAAADDLKARLARFAIVSGLEDTLAYDTDELVLALTPRGAALGLTPEGVGAELSARLTGVEAARFPDGQRTARVRVRLPESERAGDFLDRAHVRTPEGAWVRLAEVVEAEPQAGFASVRRENGERVVTVTGAVADDDPAAAASLMEALRAEILPEIAADHGVTWRLGGLAEQERDFLSDALLGFVLCLVGIYLVLAWIFASWTRPMVVMAIIPFGLIGTLYGHWAWGLPASMFTVVGLIGMTGIIVNNAIVLVTSIDEHGQRRALKPAVVDAACDRLRPILLTSLTTVIGLAPLLFERSQQAEFLKPTVVTLVYGLGLGVLLVLLIVPALVAVQRDVAVAWRAMRRALGAVGRAPALARRVRLAGLVGGAGVVAGLAAISGWVAAGVAAGLLALAAAGWSGRRVARAG
jgi:multidrug efflux pump subunit AcrB